MRSKMTVILALFLCAASIFVNKAEALIVGASLQVHNPIGGPATSNEGNNAKSQFVVQNDSDAGIEIDSVVWTFANSLFIDSTAAAPGVYHYLNYTESPATTYSAGGFDISVLVNSDLLTGYTGPTNFIDGWTSLSLSFDDFDPNEAFAFWTDLDGTNPKGHVGNSDLNGMTTQVTFSNGMVLNYQWVLPLNNGRSAGYQLHGEIPSAPEPASMILFGTGLVGAVLRKRFKA